MIVFDKTVICQAQVDNWFHGGTKVPIVPIGSDCHPAHVISKLNLRNESFPFDWLNMKAGAALPYVQECLETKFEHFLKDLKKNKDKLVFASKYPDVTFFHHKQIIFNRKLQAKFMKRTTRMLELVEQGCILLHTTKIDEIDTSFVQTVVKFDKFIGEHFPACRVCIYARFNDKVDHEHKVLKQLKQMAFGKTIVVPYLLEKKKFGIWGDEAQYPKLLASLGL